MAARALWAILISTFFASVLYTTNGCGGTPTEPQHLASLSGTVTDSVSGAPISGASISVSWHGNSPFTTTSGADGRYTVNGLAAGDIRIDVVAGGHQPFSSTANLNDGANTLNIRLVPST